MENLVSLIQQWTISDYAKDDLMQDFISLVTIFCARIYGKRRSKRKTENIIFLGSSVGGSSRLLI